MESGKQDSALAVADAIYMDLVFNDVEDGPTAETISRIDALSEHQLNELKMIAGEYLDTDTGQWLEGYLGLSI